MKAYLVVKDFGPYEGYDVISVWLNKTGAEHERNLLRVAEGHDQHCVTEDDPLGEDCYCRHKIYEAPLRNVVQGTPILAEQS